MAGNSVPVFFGAKARTKKPPGIDVTFITDNSQSMNPYASFIASISTISALETALLNEGVGIVSTNRYSFTVGGGQPGTGNYDSLSEIERFVTVNGVTQRWALGTNILNDTVKTPSYSSAPTENMGLASNLVMTNDRDYLAANEQIIIAGSDEQSYFTTFNVSPAYPHRYIGVHKVDLSITEPAGPNPVPAGTLIGFVYTTATTGAAIYNDNGSLNYRLEVPRDQTTANAAGGTLQLNVNYAKTTNGAIYDIDVDFALLGESLGTVLGNYLYTTA